jgi:hypothetical protein
MIRGDVPVGVEISEAYDACPQRNGPGEWRRSVVVACGYRDFT